VVEAAPVAVVERATGFTLVQMAAAPILGLAFVVFLPIIGIGAMAWVAARKIGSLVHAA
jgi:hypothetical protein